MQEITSLEQLMDSPPKKQRMVTRQDGSQVEFSEKILDEYLQDKLEGLNK